MPAFKKFEEAATKRLIEMQEKNQTLKVWWRDDDCIEPTKELDKLIKISKENQAPISLAVIPKFCVKELKEVLAPHSQIEVLQHGIAHLNQASSGQKKCEFPDTLVPEKTSQDIMQGKLKLSTLFAEQFTPIFVPPWNRYSTKHLNLIHKSNFKKISGYGHSQDPFYFNTHFDLINWKQGRSLIEENQAIELFQEITTLDSTIGLLSHHLVHDQAIWNFIEFLIPFLKGFDNVSFVSAKESI